MGIAIAIFYLPLYILFSIIAVYASKKLGKGNQYKYYVTGFISSIALTLLFIWLIPIKGNTDWEALYLQLGLTLTAPIALSLTALLLCIITNKEKLKVSLISGILHSIVAIPWVTLFAASNYHNIVNFPQYYSVCQKSNIEFIQQIGPVASVLLLPDLFTSAAKGSQSETRPIGLFLLNQSRLEYIERVTPQNSENYGKSPYEKIHTQGERVFKAGKNKNTTYIITPIHEITSKYAVSSNNISVKGGKEKGLGGSYIKVYDHQTNEIISSSEYYWDNKTYKSCPEKAHDGLFIYKFLAKSLNVHNEKNSILKLN